MKQSKWRCRCENVKRAWKQIVAVDSQYTPQPMRMRPVRNQIKQLPRRTKISKDERFSGAGKGKPPVRQIWQFRGFMGYCVLGCAPLEVFPPSFLFPFRLVPSLLQGYMLFPADLAPLQARDLEVSQMSRSRPPTRDFLQAVVTRHGTRQ